MCVAEWMKKKDDKKGGGRRTKFLGDGGSFIDQPSGALRARDSLEGEGGFSTCKQGGVGAPICVLCCYMVPKCY